MQIIGLQLDSVWENKAANHDKVLSLLDKARPQAGALVVLPEMFATGFSMNVAAIHDESRETQNFLSRAAAERSFAFLKVDTVAAEAGEAPVTLYAILGNPVLKASPKFRALTTFHDHIFQALRKQQWRQARALIEQCRKLSGASPRLYDLHLDRIGYYEHAPPGEDWDGAFRPILK